MKWNTVAATDCAGMNTSLGERIFVARGEEWFIVAMQDIWSVVNH
jgi:hypothetical protein